MQSICDSVIRCLCSCLINKTPIAYSEVNEEHQFMKISEQIEDEHRVHTRQQKQYLNESTAASVASKLSNFLEEEQFEKSHEKTEEVTGNLHQTLQQKPGENASSKLKGYSDVIGADHPFFSLFQDKLAMLNTIFQVPDNACTAEPDTLYPLKLYCYQQGKLNTFKYFFKFPTDYHSYESISNDFDLQKKFDANIDEFKKILETPGGDTKLIYLSYKKVLIMSSRDFEYVRYSFKKENQFWNICVSDMSREEVKGKVRGEMVITATRIIEHNGEIEVSVSSTTDMKIPIKLQIAKNRGFAQIRKYLDRVYAHLKEEESKSIL